MAETIVTVMAVSTAVLMTFFILLQEGKGGDSRRWAAPRQPASKASPTRFAAPPAGWRGWMFLLLIVLAVMRKPGSSQFQGVTPSAVETEDGAVGAPAEPAGLNAAPPPAAALPPAAPAPGANAPKDGAKAETPAAAPADAGKPAENKPAEAAKPADASKPAEVAKPADAAKPAEAAKPTDAKPAEGAKPADPAKTEVAPVKPDETKK